MQDLGRIYRGILRPLLFTLPAELAHATGIKVLRAAGRSAVLWRSHFFVQTPALRVLVGSGPGTIEFPNPVGLAAGYDKNAEALPALAGLGFGFLEAGTLTPRPQPGNPKPRLFRFRKQQAIVNRLGFNNRGVAAALRHLSRVQLPVPLGINLGKNRDTPLESAVEDYLQGLDVLFDWADYFVINISSPNTPGLRELQAVAALKPLLAALKERRDGLAKKRLPEHSPRLFVKVSPDEDLAEEFVDTVAQSGFDGIIATNTTLSREGLTGKVPPDGGVSGRPLFKRSNEALARLFRIAKGRLVFIGTGGVFSAEDAYEKILAGASLVQLYTGFIYEGPGIVRRINHGLLKLLAQDGFLSVRDAVGKKT